MLKKIPTALGICLVSVLVFSMVTSKNAEPPDTIEFIVQWNLAEHAPDQLEAFLAAVHASEEEISSEMPWCSPLRLVSKFGRLGLGRGTGLSRLHVRVDSFAQKPSSEWVETEHLVPITTDADEMTVGELLFYLHQAVHEVVKESEFAFAESLALESMADDGSPIYELFLGS